MNFSAIAGAAEIAPQTEKRPVMVVPVAKIPLIGKTQYHVKMISKNLEGKHFVFKRSYIDWFTRHFFTRNTQQIEIAHIKITLFAEGIIKKIKY